MTSLDPTHRRLLLADDDSAIRDALGEFFAREGFAVEMAASGLEAFELLRRRMFDVSVLDGHMPGLTGPQVLAQLLRDRGPAAIPPTLLVSSDASIGAWLETWVREERGRTGGSCGVAFESIGFVPKPVRLDALRASLHRLLAPPQGPAPR